MRFTTGTPVSVLSSFRFWGIQFSRKRGDMWGKLNLLSRLLIYSLKYLRMPWSVSRILWVTEKGKGRRKSILSQKRDMWVGTSFPRETQRELFTCLWVLEQPQASLLSGEWHTVADKAQSSRFSLTEGGRMGTSLKSTSKTRVRLPINLRKFLWLSASAEAS